LQQMQAEKVADTSTYYAPITDLVGGSGGGIATGTAQQLDEFAAGGSKNTGGNYSLDFTEWTPTTTSSKSSSSSSSSSSNISSGSNSSTSSKVSKVTGKSGSVESQLSGMSQAEKYSTLKKAGLA